MMVRDLLDLPLRTVLSDYCVLYNDECGFSWGVVRSDLVDFLLDGYVVDDCDNLVVRGLISSDVLDLDSELLSRDRVIGLLNDLDVDKKE